MRKEKGVEKKKGNGKEKVQKEDRCRTTESKCESKKVKYIHAKKN
jgi:hypothetical protein